MYNKNTKVFNKRIVEVSKLNRMYTSIILLSITSICLLISTIIFGCNNMHIKNTIASSKISIGQLADNIDKYVEIKAENDALKNENYELEEVNTSILNSMFEVDLQNVELNDKLEKANVTLDELQEATELYENYGYALTYQNARTDLTLKELKRAEEVCKENDVPMELLMGVVMTESSGKSDAKNANSTATGYGQLIYSTAKSVYENDMKAGEYCKEYALDGETNLVMTTTYLGKLLKVKTSTQEALYAYRGLRDEAYVNKIMNYANKHKP